MLAENIRAAWDIASVPHPAITTDTRNRILKEDCETSHNDLLKIADELFISKPE